MLQAMGPHLCTLGNDCHHKSSYRLSPFIVTNSFLVTFKIYSLSSFQICSTVLLTVVTMLYINIPRTYVFCNCKLIPFDPFTILPHMSPFPCPSCHQSAPCNFELGFACWLAGFLVPTYSDVITSFSDLGHLA